MDSAKFGVEYHKVEIVTMRNACSQAWIEENNNFLGDETSFSTFDVN